MRFANSVYNREKPAVQRTYWWTGIADGTKHRISTSGTAKESLYGINTLSREMVCIHERVNTFGERCECGEG
jgi:hypothetical protein